MHPHGFLRVTAASTSIAIANPASNRLAIENAVRTLSNSDIIVFGELCLSGYTCGELFLQKNLLDACVRELIHLTQSINTKQLIVVGLPLVVDAKLFNVAAVLCQGKILGLVPKQHLPTYQEFYEGRWFQPGGTPSPREAHISLAESDSGGDSFYRSHAVVPFGTDLLFACGNAIVGVEICEDLWVPIPPSSMQAIAGANILLNLSASNETIGKANYRTRLVTTQSGKCISAYAYAGAGPSESTTDVVFGGHCLIAENGSLLCESERIGTGLNLPTALQGNSLSSHATADIDLDRLDHDRRVAGTMHQTNTCLYRSEYRRIPFELELEDRPLERFVDPHPFVPKASTELQVRCAEVFEIQCAALAKRITRVPSDVPIVIGVSGGLDSTLALIVAAKVFDLMQLGSRRLVGITMPGFGTSQKTLDNACKLTQLLGVELETIDIRERCMGIFRDLKHRPFGLSLENKDYQSMQFELEQLPTERRNDLVFENVQARMRTMLLMNRGFVVGTGDLSESALGWSTYNADHMSMYNVNCSVPKTLVKFLVRYVATNRYDGAIRQVLLDIADTPISPELLPLNKNKELHQSTEFSIGPYELHDFFLYHFVRFGASPAKIQMLAENAKFDSDYEPEQIAVVLKTFMKRFFASQYKRTCVPDGPKVGTVSLSPRGDWRMPSDADPTAWLQ
ncbi:MAG: NAD(+) synthase [Pirellula sp.]